MKKLSFSGKFRQCGGVEFVLSIIWTCVLCVGVVHMCMLLLTWCCCSSCVFRCCMGMGCFFPSVFLCRFYSWTLIGNTCAAVQWKSVHLDMLYDRLLSVLFIVMLRILILLFCSSYIVNCKFGWLLLNSYSIRFVLVSFSLYFSNLSSMYLKVPVILCLTRVLSSRNCKNIVEMVLPLRALLLFEVVVIKVEGRLWWNGIRYVFSFCYCILLCVVIV
jgi:hypothetical protein